MGGFFHRKMVAHLQIISDSVGIELHFTTLKLYEERGRLLVRSLFPSLFFFELLPNQSAGGVSLAKRFKLAFPRTSTGVNRQGML